MPILSQRVLERRMELKMSQTELAQAACVDPSYINKIEKGLKSPSADVLRLIAEKLKCSADKLLY